MKVKELTAEPAKVWKNQQLSEDEENHVEAFVRMLDRYPIIDITDVQNVIRNRYFRYSIHFRYMLCIGSLAIPGSEMVHQYTDVLSVNMDFDTYDDELRAQLYLLKAAFHGFLGSISESVKDCKTAMRYIQKLDKDGHERNSRGLMLGYISLAKSFSHNVQDIRHIHDTIKKLEFGASAIGLQYKLLKYEQESLLCFNPQLCACGKHMEVLKKADHLIACEDKTHEKIMARNYISCILPEVTNSAWYLLEHGFKISDSNCSAISAVQYIFEFLETATLLHNHDRLLYFWREYNYLSFFAASLLKEELPQYVMLDRLVNLLNNANFYKSQFLNNATFDKELKQTPLTKKGGYHKLDIDSSSITS